MQGVCTISAEIMLPYGGIARIRFHGYLSTGNRAGTPAFDAKIRRGR